MKKIIAQTVVLLLTATCSLAQEKQQFNTDNIPVDKISKLITYTEVVSVKGVSTGVLYKRAFDWFNKYYKNPTDVIRKATAPKELLSVSRALKYPMRPIKQACVPMPA